MELEPPEKLSKYTKQEAVTQLRRTAAKSNDRILMMNEMIKLHFVLCSTQTLHRLMKLDSQGIFIGDTPWTNTGWKTLISDGDVEEFVANCGAKNSGMAYTRAMMGTMIEQDTVPVPRQQQDKHTSLLEMSCFQQATLSARLKYWRTNTECLSLATSLIQTATPRKSVQLKSSKIDTDAKAEASLCWSESAQNERQEQARQLGGPPSKQESASNCDNHGRSESRPVWYFTTWQCRLSRVAVNEPVLTMHDSRQSKRCDCLFWRKQKCMD
jgi:hypothetical protein